MLFKTFFAKEMSKRDKETKYGWHGLKMIGNLVLKIAKAVANFGRSEQTSKPDRHKVFWNAQ